MAIETCGYRATSSQSFFLKMKSDGLRHGLENNQTPLLRKWKVNRPVSFM